MLHDQVGVGERSQAVLVGAAGTLGAVAVQQQAAALEAAIQALQPISELTPLINQTEQSYQDLAARIAFLHGTAPANPQLVLELRHRLQAGDMDVQKLLNQQTGEIRMLLGDSYHQFKRSISNFDFESALRLLDQAQIPDNDDASA